MSENRKALEKEQARAMVAEEEKWKAYASKNQQQKRKLQKGNQVGDKKPRNRKEKAQK